MKNTALGEKFRTECQKLWGDYVSHLYPTGKSPDLFGFTIYGDCLGVFNIEERELYPFQKMEYKAAIWLNRDPDNNKYDTRWQNTVIAQIEEIAKKLKIAFFLPSNCLLD